MHGKITLEVINGPIRGMVFAFEEHDVLIFGRDPDCHARLSDNDLTASRHHFVLEVNPPYARLRDLGSLNGTYVNENKYGGRLQWESPHAAALRQYPEVDLRDGDRIRVGETIFVVRLEAQSFCQRCGTLIPEAFQSVCRKESAGFICPQCLSAPQTLPAARRTDTDSRCKQCGKDVADELAGRAAGDYICQSCRLALQSNPILAVADALIAKYKKGSVSELAKNEIPGYEVLSIIGYGGMGAVYLVNAG